MFLCGLRAIVLSLPAVAILGVLWPLGAALLWIFRRPYSSHLRLARLWSRALVTVCFVKVQTEGLERLDTSAAYLLAVNHPSYLDIPVLYCALPLRFRIMADYRLFRNPWLCVQLRSSGQLRVGHANPGFSITGVRGALRAILKIGDSVVIFPEEPHTDSALHPFRYGAAFISIKAGVPVVPISLSGTRRLKLERGKFVVSMKVDQPIATAALSKRDRAWLTQRVHARVAAMLQEQ